MSRHSRYHFEQLGHNTLKPKRAFDFSRVVECPDEAKIRDDSFELQKEVKKLGLDTHEGCFVLLTSE